MNTQQSASSPHTEAPTYPPAASLTEQANAAAALYERAEKDRLSCSWALVITD